MKITSFIIGLVVASLVVSVFGLWLTDANTQYGSSFDETELESFEQLDEINELSENIQSRVQNQTTDPSLYDVVGGFLADAKDTLLISAASYDIFFNMANTALEKLGLPNIFNLALMTVIVIVVFLGIILATILGREL